MKDNNFIVIQGWMCNKLKLSGNDLLVYALIYGFSQDGESKFNGSISYICNVLNISKNTAKKALDGLVERGLIIKTDLFIKKIKFCEYSFSVEGYNSALGGIAETDLPCQKLVWGMAVSDPNNISLKNTNKTTTTKLEEESSSSLLLDFLEKNEYSNLNCMTKENIKKEFPKLLEQDFLKIYNLAMKEFTSGFANSFDAVLFSGLKNKWHFRADIIKNKTKTMVKDYENIILGIYNSSITYSLVGYSEINVIELFRKDTEKYKGQLSLIQRYENKIRDHFKKGECD